MGRKTLVAIVLATSVSAIFAPSAHAASTPLPLTCPTTITTPGSYVLTTPRGPCSATAVIVIDASNVTLDLNGRTVIGDGSVGQICISVPNTAFHDVIKNGTVRSCETGIKFAPTVTQSTVSGVTAANNKNGIIASNGNRFIGDSIAGNTTYGLQVGDSNLIARNSINGNGVAIEGGSSNHVIKNVMSGNVNGLGLQNSNLISGNVLKSNPNHGLSVASSNRITNNFVSGTSNDGIAASDNNTIIGNVSNGNEFDGIDVGANNVLRRNRANGNVGTGIFIVNPTSLTTLAGNTADGNRLNGIDADQAPDLAKGSGNKARGNGGTNCTPARLC